MEKFNEHLEYRPTTGEGSWYNKIFTTLVTLFVLGFLCQYDCHGASFTDCLSSALAIGGLLRLDTSNPPPTDRPPLPYNNVLVASYFKFDFDAYLAVVWMTERVKQDHGKVQSYMPVPNLFDFELVNESGLYNKKTDGYIKNITHLVESGGGIDLLILGYCEYDMQYSWWSQPLLKAWDARDAAHKFDIACIVHSVPTVRGWIREAAEWNRRNAIRMFPILQHYGRDFRTAFDGLSRAQPVDSSQEPVFSKSRGFEYIPRRPTLDPPKPAERPPNRVFSNAVIIGSFDRKQRDYSRLFIDFITSLHTDPTQWGYLPPKTGRSFIPDPSPEHPPFRLHLIGNGRLSVPAELKNFVVLHTKLNYTEFYHTMNEMDICLPPFNSTSDKNYDYHAVSVVRACESVKAPILIAKQFRDLPSFIKDRLIIIRPDVMSEVDALKALRTGSAAAFLASDPSHSGIALGANSTIRSGVEKMMREGWTNRKKLLEDARDEIWHAVRASVMEILGNK